MKKEQVDLANAVVWIPDSKTPNGVGEVPLTKLAVQAFRDQIALSGQGEYLFPSKQSTTGYQYSLRTSWRLTLKRAKIPYFRNLRSALDIRHTPQCGRRSRRVDHPVASTRRLAGV